MHYTSDTEFCLSCHSMEIPCKEYQGSVHFSKAKGIRAECSDCHIPKEPMDYLVTKIHASKDIYHEFVTGKIDTPEKYEAHRTELVRWFGSSSVKTIRQPVVLVTTSMQWKSSSNHVMRRRCTHTAKRMTKRVSTVTKA